jgi:excisionase family DNA binding protein
MAHMSFVTIPWKTLEGVKSMEKRFLSVREAAQLLNLSQSAIRLWISQGRLRCVRAGGRVLIDRPLQSFSHNPLAAQVAESARQQFRQQITKHTEKSRRRTPGGLEI